MITLDFSQLVEDFYVPLFRFALSLCMKEADACDLTLRAFEIWREPKPADRDTRKARIELFAILHREFLARIPRHEGSGEVEEDTGTVDAPQMEASMINALDGAFVQDALHRLHVRYRGAVSLFYLRRHSYEEIAEILELTVEQVLARIARGKAELRKALSYPPDEKAKRSAARKLGADESR